MTFFKFQSYLIFFILVKFIHTTIEGNQTDGCEPGWKQHNKTCFIVVPSKQTWSMAQELCKSTVFGGKLAEVQTQEIKLFFDDYLGRTYENAFSSELFWLGGTDQYMDGHWVWSSSNATIAPSFWWEKATPTSNNSFNCLTVGKFTLNRFKDENCSAKHFFVCEKSLPELSTTATPTTLGIFGGNQNGDNVNSNQQTVAPDVDTNHELPVFVG